MDCLVASLQKFAVRRYRCRMSLKLPNPIQDMLEFVRMDQNDPRNVENLRPNQSMEHERSHVHFEIGKGTALQACRGSPAKISVVHQNRIRHMKPVSRCVVAAAFPGKFEHFPRVRIYIIKHI